MTGRQSFELLVELSSTESSYPTVLSVDIQTLHRAKFRGLPAFEVPRNIPTTRSRFQIGYVAWVQVIFNNPKAMSLRRLTALMRLMFQNQTCPQYYVHKRYASQCQIWFSGIEL